MNATLGGDRRIIAGLATLAPATSKMVIRQPTMDEHTELKAGCA